MSIGDSSLKKESLKPRKLRATSSPGKVAGSKSDKPVAVAAVTTADAVDATTTQDLVNELKAKMNELLAALKK